MKQKQQVQTNTYTKPERAMYLTGLFGQNIIYNVIATGMAYYFQSVIFLPAMAIRPSPCGWPGTGCRPFARGRL